MQTFKQFWKGRSLSTYKRGDKITVSYSNGETHSGKFIRIDIGVWGKVKKETLVIETNKGTIASPVENVINYK